MCRIYEENLDQYTRLHGRNYKLKNIFCVLVSANRLLALRNHCLNNKTFEQRSSGDYQRQSRQYL